MCLTCCSVFSCLVRSNGSAFSKCWSFHRQNAQFEAQGRSCRQERWQLETHRHAGLPLRGKVRRPGTAAVAAQDADGSGAEVVPVPGTSSPAGGDPDSERLRRDTNFQRGPVQDIARAVEAHLSGEATHHCSSVTSSRAEELRRLVADFNHAKILFCRVEKLKASLTTGEG